MGKYYDDHFDPVRVKDESDTACDLLYFHRAGGGSGVHVHGEGTRLRV